MIRERREFTDMIKTTREIKIKREADVKPFLEFLTGKGAGAGVPEVSDPNKPSLSRDADGHVVAKYRGHVLARASVDKETQKTPIVQIFSITPDKSIDGVMGMFETCYRQWSNDRERDPDMIKRVKEKVNELLDPPKNGEPRVVLNSVTRADIEELSLRDVLKEVLPEGVELVKFERNDQRIRVYYEFGDSGIQVPLLSAWHEDGKTVLRSGDGIAPAPVAFFQKLLGDAKAYNRQNFGPKRIKDLMVGMTEDLHDEAVSKAFAQYFETQTDTLRHDLSDVVTVTLSPANKTANVYIDKKLIAQSQPGGMDKMWIRPGYGWSNRSEFSQRAITEAGRNLIKENKIGTGPGQDWERDLQNELG